MMNKGPNDTFNMLDDLNLYNLHMFKDTFSLDAAHERLLDIWSHDSGYAYLRIMFTQTLTPLCLASHKRDIGKQCRPRTDAIERSI